MSHLVWWSGFTLVAAAVPITLRSRSRRLFRKASRDSSPAQCPSDRDADHGLVRRELPPNVIDPRSLL